MEGTRRSGRIVLIGSGEIGPSMAPLHRALIASLPKRATPASLVALDGSYDFQTNRAEMGEKIAVFFRSKVGVPTTVVGLPETERAGADLPPTAFAPTLAALDSANLIFLGPGSPTRAVARWADTPIIDRLIARIDAGATLVTSSAGAAAAGTMTLPVYELYKAGLNATWINGLNLLGTLTGIRAAIIPHWNNAEGATHDTSRCYIGEARLLQLTQDLPAGVAVLGIDEHTALSIDLGTELVSVHGKGAVTIRIAGVGEIALHAGASEPLDTFVARFSGAVVPPAHRIPTPVGAPEAAVVEHGAPSQSSIAPAVERLIALRAAARAETRYADADAIREAIEALGVELTDAPTGATWVLRP